LEIEKAFFILAVQLLHVKSVVVPFEKPFMNGLAILTLGLALSVDTAAIAIASGMAISRMRFRRALQIAFAFGAVQAIMPLIGGVLGAGCRRFLAHWDHWAAFVILTVVGLKMIIESFRIREVEEERKPLHGSVLLLLAVATSVDALAVGVTLGLAHEQIVRPAIGIGLVTFGVALGGLYLGRHSRHFHEQAMEFLAGLVLIGLGVKFLMAHLGAG